MTSVRVLNVIGEVLNVCDMMLDVIDDVCEGIECDW
jgi:hypothetical protein